MPKSRLNQSQVRSALLITVSLLAVSGCKQILSDDFVRFADKSSFMASDMALHNVDRVFYQSFSVGNWQYKGTKVNTGKVYAYIQIPEKLDMPAEIQQRYLQQVICPGTDNIDLWHQLRNVDLSVHIYTLNKRQSVSATCINPFKTKSV